MIELAALVPHPPIMVDEVGGNDTRNVSATRAGMDEVAEAIRRIQPETVILVSPHAPMFADAVGISGQPVLRGNLKRFGAAVGVEFGNDSDLARAIVAETQNEAIPGVLLTEEHTRRFRLAADLDHGATVPLWLLNASLTGVRVVVMGFAGMPLEDLYDFGGAVARAVEKVGRRTVFLASGDLSHRVTRDAPAGYHPKGAEFDAQLVAMLGKLNVEGIMSFDPALIEQAGECGLRSLVIMLGALDGRQVDTRVLSYEAPFGVGYAVALFQPGEADPGRRLAGTLREQCRRQLERAVAAESPLVKLARRVVEARVLGKPIPPPPDDLPEVARSQAGVFVSIKKHGQLRGCIGTFEPTQLNVAEEIKQNAISAAFRDPRFDPVEESELGDLIYSVDVLTPPEAIDSESQLDPVRYGVIVRKGLRQGLLLPDLEGVNTIAEQVSIAKRKAGIKEHEPVEVFRFEVVRYR